MRFLIIKTSALGDIVQAFGVAHYLRQRYPDCTIDWVVERASAPLVERHPLIDRVLQIDTRRWRKAWWRSEYYAELALFRDALQEHRYDVCFDLQGNIKSSIVVRMARAEEKVGFGRRTVPEWPNLFSSTCQFDPPKGQSIREDYLHLALRWAEDEASFEDSGIRLRLSEEERASLSLSCAEWETMPGRKILVCHGSRWKNKQVSEPCLQDFLQRIGDAEEANFLFAWASAEEREIAERIAGALGNRAQVLPKLSLPALQNVMAELDLVIAMDSLPLHLCATTGTPSYAVFGASSAKKYNPPGDLHRAFQGACPYGQSFDKRCSKLRKCESGACIRDLNGLSLYRDFFAWQQETAPVKASLILQP